MCPRSFLPAALALGLVILVAVPANAGRQRIFKGPASLRGLTFQSVQFSVPGDWMRAPRLAGRLDVSGSGRRDLDLIVLRDADLAAWEKNLPVRPIHSAPRGTSFELDLALPGPGSYVLVLSNRFSKLASKQVAGEVVLAWDDDPSLPTGEALKARVRFVDDIADGVDLVVPLADGDTAAHARITDPGARGPHAIEVDRPAANGGGTISVGTWTGDLEAVGAVDVHGDGDRDLFLTGVRPDSAGSWRDLVLVCPRQRAMLVLSMRRAGAAGAPPTLRFGEGYADARFAADQSFLERIRTAYATP